MGWLRLGHPRLRRSVAVIREMGVDDPPNEGTGRPQLVLPAPDWPDIPVVEEGQTRPVRTLHVLDAVFLAETRGELGPVTIAQGLAAYRRAAPVGRRDRAVILTPARFAADVTAAWPGCGLVLTPIRAGELSVLLAREVAPRGHPRYALVSIATHDGWFPPVAASLRAPGVDVRLIAPEAWRTHRLLDIAGLLSRQNPRRPKRVARRDAEGGTV